MSYKKCNKMNLHFIVRDDIFMECMYDVGCLKDDILYHLPHYTHLIINGLWMNP